MTKHEIMLKVTDLAAAEGDSPRRPVLAVATMAVLLFSFVLGIALVSQPGHRRIIHSLRSRSTLRIQKEVQLTELYADLRRDRVATRYTAEPEKCLE